ncbi:beta-lactamase-like protein [Gautieria morchelliformis]|nr:beta-lactamase-like protein [Gautieria morchelliformis]
MPPGTPHHSFILPYRIRVDDFMTPRDRHFEPPALYLLSHTHSDHITGLSAKSFGARVVCSIDAKHMLLNYEYALDRIAFDKGEIPEKRRPYAHLKIYHIPSARSKRKTYSRDLLKALPLNSPTTIELSDDVTVTLTLLDANHCPGAVMFLVEGPLGNFLHTGDLRAETSFLESLARNPWLQRYIPPLAAFHDPANDSGEKPLRTLDAIHLDTACLLSHHDLLGKTEACAGLVDLISLFPPLTRFFINSWTWGYEDILKAIGRAFNSKIHVDRYKFDIYSGISDPFLKSLLTLDAVSTRFHACERKDRCDQVGSGTTGVVCINPISLSKIKWVDYFRKTRVSIQRGEHVSNLLCPLSRHSSLPELQAFVKLFKPKLVVPNSLNPELANFDWGCMPRMFGDCLADGGQAAMIAHLRSAYIDTHCLDYAAPTSDIDSLEISAEIDNLVGEGAESLVRQWISTANAGGATRELRMTTQLGKFLGPRGKQLLLNAIASRKRPDPNNQDSQGEGEDEARGRAADFFFAPTSPMVSSTSSVDKMRNASSSSPSHSPSEPIVTHRSTPNPRTTPLTTPPRSKKHTLPSPFSMDSPIDSKVSQISAASISTPLFNSLRWSDERAYHSLLDALQFNKTSSSPSHLPVELRQELSPQPSAVSSLHFAKGVLDSMSALEQVSRLPAMPLVSPSVTPSPPRRSQHTPTRNLTPKVPPTPVSRSNPMPLRDRRGQPSDVVTRPPMLDLKKILKRNASSAGLSRPSGKRSRNARSTVGTLKNSPSAAKHKIVPGRLSLEGPAQWRQEPQLQPPPAQVCSFARRNHEVATSVHQTITSSSPISPPPSRSLAEKERRSQAKAKQLRIREKLVCALPPDQVTPTCKAKVARREQELAELRARNKTAIIFRKQSVYGPCEGLPPLPQCSLPRQPDPPEPEGAICGFRRGVKVVSDESAMDWDKSTEYQEGIRMQRKVGIRYPELPRLERSFAESLSPSP